MEATIQREPSMGYRMARKGWKVYFFDASRKRYEGTVKSATFATGRRISVEVEIASSEGTHSIMVYPGSLESAEFYSE